MALPTPARAQRAPLSHPPRALPEPPPRAPATPRLLAPDLSLRLGTLEQALSSLPERRSKRLWVSALQTALGAAGGVGAFFLHDPVLRSGIAISSGVTAARGIVQLAHSLGRSDATQAFWAAPARGSQELEAKLRLGERALRSVVRAERRVRILNATITLLGAAAFVPTLWALEQRDDPAYRFGQSAGDYVALSLSVIAFASGLVNAFVPSEAERFLRAYQQMCAQLNSRQNAF
jgi:hypothetical protein